MIILRLQLSSYYSYYEVAIILFHTYEHSIISHVYSLTKNANKILAGRYYIRLENNDSRAIRVVGTKIKI